jgi:DAK2 domain
VTDRLDAAGALAWTEAWDRAVAEQWEELGRLDELAGDGDFGTNLRATLGRARPRWQSDTTACWAALSEELFAAGGASGPLLGVWFRAWADGLAAGPLTLVGLAAAARDGTETVMRFGGASQGDRTMVDAMMPAVETLEAVPADTPLLAVVGQAATAARQGAQATAGMTPRRGRATYLGERAIGHPDAGAAAIALWWEAGTAAGA